jgi:hypothetical protein
LGSKPAVLFKSVVASEAVGAGDDVGTGVSVGAGDDVTCVAFTLVLVVWPSTANAVLVKANSDIPIVIAAIFFFIVFPP